ncbi:MAG: NADP oxidoreductase [Candidatus Sumerlaeota bacterium]|nr:NADP oxidoreductase [Candidatus Sumerlaeota bacterium]
MNKKRLATIWLDGCSGCHMSFLDLDEALLTVGEKADLVYGPFVDAKVFPEGVDITLVEGAVGTEADVEKITVVRSRTKVLAALGDCAVTGNVPSMRNHFGTEACLKMAYLDGAPLNAQVPTQTVPALRSWVVPVHEIVKVDLHIPGCPPSAKTILHALSELLEGRIPDLTNETRFGA